jgi:hypothetical protein
MVRKDGKALRLRPTWPLYITVPSARDAFDSRLAPGDLPTQALLHVIDEKTFLPTAVEVEVTVQLDYYAGQSDGFAGFGTVCPEGTGSARSPTMCMPLN